MYQIISSKVDLWNRWLEAHVYPDLMDELTADPIPLFTTDDRLQVERTNASRLKRSDAIDKRIPS